MALWRRDFSTPSAETVAMGRSAGSFSKKCPKIQIPFQMSLFLLRHGQSHGNATGDYSMLDLDPLSEEGQKQAEQATEALTGVSLEKIVVSPLLRATQTAFPYLEKTGRKAEVWPEIAEVRTAENHSEPTHPQLHQLPIQDDSSSGFGPRDQMSKPRAPRGLRCPGKRYWYSLPHGSTGISRM